jgi:hypothetical protein
MTSAVRLLSDYQNYIFALLGLAAVGYLVSLARARRYLSRTPFGLEREEALRRQNRALGMLSLMVIVAVLIYSLDSLIIPDFLLSQASTPTAPPPTPSPSPVVAPEGVVVDSSGCENPEATLLAPEPYERIIGSFEVRGTANTENLAFYKFEISGAGTGGEWLSLGVGTSRVVEDVLGRFDAGARDPGEYAFRLVVLDNAGRFPPPCVVPIAILSSQPP